MSATDADRHLLDTFEQMDADVAQAIARARSAAAKLIDAAEISARLGRRRHSTDTMKAVRPGEPAAPATEPLEDNEDHGLTGRFAVLRLP
jgi:hypothetical protein